MGNGSATSLAISTAKSLGANAREVITGDVVSFDALDMNSASGGSWSDPRWTSSMSMSSSACLTAFHQVHACEQAAAALFDTGLYPAACRIWTAGGGKAPEKKATVWKDGALRAPGSPPLPLAQIAAEIFAGGLVAGAMVHAFYQGQWVAAKYTVDGVTAERPIDGFSTRLAAATAWRVHDRREVKAPPASNALWGRSLYAPSGALAAVEIDRATGAVQVVEIHTILDAGRVIQPDLLAGQSQGGVAMGIGYALLEKLPLTEGGAGSGRWNLDRYRVAKAGDVPMDRLKLTLLPPEGDTAKGIAEAVLCPIAPAIVNAISHATGKRFDSLPVLAEDIRKVLA
jgi:CO/xanthine dehydrogenase Mo-binding subunit